MPFAVSEWKLCRLTIASWPDDKSNEFTGTLSSSSIGLFLLFCWLGTDEIRGFLASCQNVSPIVPSNFFMNLKFFILVLSTVTTLFINVNVSAHEGSVSILDDGAVALMEGPISEITASQFSSLIGVNRGLKVLVLNSPGGRVIPALQIADMVNALGIATVVPEKASCASACSIVFFAGNERVARGQLGVHQISNVSASGAQLLLARTLDAFEKYGVDRRISRLMLTTLPEDMYFFSDYDKVKYNVNRSEAERLIESASVKVMARIDYASYPPKAFFSQDESIVLPDFSSRDAWARSYRTRIRNGLLEGPNFAGHFSIIMIGCGTGCRFAYVADAKNGEVFPFPYGGEENYEMELLFNPNSRLVKVTWIQGMDTCVQQDLVFNGREFDVVAESTTPRTDFCS